MVSEVLIPRRAAYTPHGAGRGHGEAGPRVPGDLVSAPDKDDDRGRLRHGSDHAADTHHAQEGEEGLLAPGAGAFSGNHSRVLRRDGREARTAGEVLKGSIQPFNWGPRQSLNPKASVS